MNSLKLRNPAGTGLRASDYETGHILLQEAAPTQTARRLRLDSRCLNTDVVFVGDRPPPAEYFNARCGLVGRVSC